MRQPRFSSSVFVMQCLLLSLLIGGQPYAADPKADGSIQLSSPVFQQGGSIPPRYTCDGEDVSPPLSWSSVPEGTRSLVLIVDDPDAPGDEPWVHWLLYNLPPTTTKLPEAVTARGLPPAAREGANGWQETGYRGPCPPAGRHRYRHTLYALDAELPDLGSPSKAELERAMAGHVIARAELVGGYRKSE